MKYHFKLPDFPNSDFEIETSIWTGKSKLLKDNVVLEQSKERGKPFLIPNDTGQILKAFPKPTFPDFVPSLEINGSKYSVAEKLKWYQYIIGGLPIILLFLGGAIGGGIGAVASIYNFNTFRQENTNSIKYLKVIGITILAFTAYFIFSYFFMKLPTRPRL